MQRISRAELKLTPAFPESEYEKARNKARLLSQIAEDMQTAFNDNQAGILAEHLIVGERCPVGRTLWILFPLFRIPHT